MPIPLRSKPARKLIKPHKSPGRWRKLQQRTPALSRWGDEIGAAIWGRQQDPVLREYGFTADNVALRARTLLARLGDQHGA